MSKRIIKKNIKYYSDKFQKSKLKNIIVSDDNYTTTSDEFKNLIKKILNKVKNDSSMETKFSQDFWKNIPPGSRGNVFYFDDRLKPIKQ
jgi:hypothetical protein